MLCHAAPVTSSHARPRHILPHKCKQSKALDVRPRAARLGHTWHGMAQPSPAGMSGRAGPSMIRQGTWRQGSRDVQEYATARRHDSSPMV
eukprot:364050-Chlamydomonas_euryale.AAC.6